MGNFLAILQFLNDKVRKPRRIRLLESFFANQQTTYAEYAVRDYSKPMGVTYYKTLDDMPERLRKALPDMKKMMDLLKNKEE